MKDRTRHERTPLYLLGQVDAMLSEPSTEDMLPALRDAFVQMYDLLELAQEDISANAYSCGFDAAVAREIRAFLRGEEPPALPEGDA